jgi:hypothetical protein
MTEHAIESGKWQWGHLDSLTRATVALFSGHIGRGEGRLDGNVFTADLLTIFPAWDEEEIHKLAFWGADQGLRNAYSNQLEVVGRERVQEAARQIGRLAGATEAVTALAEQVGRGMIGPERYEVHAALGVLSEMAIRNLDPEQPNMLPPALPEG